MFVQLKTGHDIDRGPSWIGWVAFNRTFKTAKYRGRELRRWPGTFDANLFDVATKEEFWLSGLKRDRRDNRYGPNTTEIDEDARDAHDAFLDGAPLPGRENG